jgi:hypothetical protein
MYYKSYKLNFKMCYFEVIASNTKEENYNWMHTNWKLDHTLWPKFVFHVATAHSGPRPPHYSDFTITLKHTTLSRTPLNGWSVRRRNLYLTTHNIHKRYSCLRWDSNQQIPTSKRPQTYALHGAVDTGFGSGYNKRQNKNVVAGLGNIFKIRYW